MYAKYSLAALCGAASIQQVAGVNVHHRHNHVKRAIEYAATEVVVETAWTTVTVHAGQGEQQAAPTNEAPNVAPAPTTQAQKEEPQPTRDAPVAPKPTTEAQAEPTQAKPTAPKPQPKPTTLTTQTREQPKPQPATTSTEEAAVDLPVPTTNINLPILNPATTTSAAKTSPTQATGGSKRGAAYNDASAVQKLLGMTDKITWAYNWGADNGGLEASIPWIPMLWGPAPEHSDGWGDKVTWALNHGSDAILSFNEPDIAEQANMDPVTAAQDHQKFMNPYSSKTRIGTPAISSSQDAGKGLDWLNSWKEACNGACAFDFCNIHWYGPGGESGADLFEQHVDDAIANCDGKPVWVTEFAAEDSDANVDIFMRRVTASMDKNPDVERYSYFMVSDGWLLEGLGALSSFGKIYAGLS